MMTPKFSELDAIDAARIIARARPDWDQPGIVAAFGRVVHELDIGQALTVAMLAAHDKAARTPGAIAWNQYRTQAATTAAVPSPRATRCPDHGTTPAERCLPCWGEHRAGQRPRHLIGLHHDIEATPQWVASSHPKGTPA